MYGIIGKGEFMQILGSIGILLLTIMIYYLLGRAFCIKCRFCPGMPEMVCIGFFFYFAVFQVIAEIMILTGQKLHLLGRVWLVLLILLVGVAAVVVGKDGKQRHAAVLIGGDGRQDRAAVDGRDGRQNRAAGFSGGGREDLFGRLLLALMVAAVLCECATAVLMQRKIGWDFAYYIGNMTTSVATDTMYVYDGSSGLLRSHLELRYALSSFYMNTAWISQLTGISALVLQKYVTGVLCVLLTNAVVYSFAMEAFRGDRKKTAVLVTASIVLTIFWDVYDTTAQFLLLRGYEAKAYCANVVLPMVCFLLYCLWKNSKDRRRWAELFLVAFASVAVSMSSLVLVPAMIVLMMLAHLLVERQLNMTVLWRVAVCVMPNVCYLVVYFASTRGWLMIKV